MNENLLTIKDICKELGIGKNTAYKLCRQRKIKSTVLGHKLIVRRKDLDEYIETMMDEEV